MGDGTNLRRLHIKSELAQLAILTERHPDIFCLDNAQTVTGDEDRIVVFVHKTPALAWPAKQYDDWIWSHRTEIVFPSLFPMVPAEFYLTPPLFHPNISPYDGWVCLWPEFDPALSIIDGLLLLRNVVTWRTANLHDAHVMQQDAAARFASRGGEGWPEWTPVIDSGPRRGRLFLFDS